jgi:hypothetical protein
LESLTEVNACFATPITKTTKPGIGLFIKQGQAIAWKLLSSKRRPAMKRLEELIK